MKKLYIIFLLVSFITVVTLMLSKTCYSQTIPSAQEASGQESLRQQEETDKKLRENLESKPKTPAIEEEAPIEEQPLPDTQKILINKIDVSGYKILSQYQIDQITTSFLNKEYDLKGMQTIAQAITSVYRKKGYITSRAVLPPQRIENNTLVINIVEGKTGNIEVRGNHFFSSALIKKYVQTKEGEIFNYGVLQSSLIKINEYRDRKVKAVLTPGKETGKTDIILNVEDKLPIHLGFSYDNFGSKYIEKHRYQSTLTHNNLLGHDDILSFQYQKSDANAYYLTAFRYLYPVTTKTKVGFYYGRSYTELRKEYIDLKVRGKSKIFDLFLTRDVIKSDTLSLQLNTGFTYKDVFNFQFDNESSRDRLRIAKIGLNADKADKFGRTIFNNQLYQGLPDVMGGLQDKDKHASRIGAGGKFTKNVIDLVRLQKLPFDTTFLFKNQFQFASRTLPATEQFQVGGIVNVRGYAPGESSGDNGQTMTGEFNFPLYGVPKNIEIPFLKTKLYDAFKIAAFYDWGRTELRHPSTGERKDDTLRSAGVGLRLNLPNDFSARVDTAWNLDRLPSDENHVHTWLQIRKNF